MGRQQVRVCELGHAAVEHQRWRLRARSQSTSVLAQLKDLLLCIISMSYTASMAPVAPTVWLPRANTTRPAQCPTARLQHSSNSICSGCAKLRGLRKERAAIISAAAAPIEAKTSLLEKIRTTSTTVVDKLDKPDPKRIRPKKFEEEPGRFDRTYINFSLYPFPLAPFLERKTVRREVRLQLTYLAWGTRSDCSNTANVFSGRS